MTELKRDYVIVYDKSGSMSTADCNGKTRWDAAKESAMAIARKCETLDPDGIDAYFFNNSFKRYEGVKSEKIEQIFGENDPIGGTDTAGVLTDIFRAWRENGKKPTTALIVTDGEPNDQAAVKRAIIEVTKEMDADEQLALSFLQIGRDGGAKSFLESLDDDLVGQGAKFDIVDTKTFDAIEAGNLTIADVLIAAVDD
jgi:uncharacterized protein with von Willebrand factor type A (vWA) domain